MDPEKESQACSQCGYPSHAGHGPECSTIVGPEAREAEPLLTISRIDPNDSESIAAYYQFELTHGFSTLRPGSTLAGMVRFRQEQMWDNKLRVATAKEGEELVGTSVVVLEKGTMGKDVQEDEAWAAGTLVAPAKRRLGIGERLAAEQDAIAKEAGKKFIITIIRKDTADSMRLRLKVGYRLEGVEEREDETDYKYRKDLTKEAGVLVDWAEDVRDGRIREQSGEINQDSPDEILINPEDTEKIKDALQKGYQGVYLLRPADFGNEKIITKNLIVFNKRNF